MPGGSKKGGGLKVGSAYKMKNSALHMGAKYGSPIQGNYSSPNKDYSIGKGSHDHPHGAAKYASPAKETDAEFEAKLKAQGMTVAPTVNVKRSEHEDTRDKLAKKALSNINPTGGHITRVSQAKRSAAYGHADKYLEKNRAKETRENTEE